MDDGDDTGFERWFSEVTSAPATARELTAASSDDCDSICF